MVLFESTATLVILGAVFLLHIAAEIFCGILSKIISIVNICLHIALLVPIIIDGVPIAEAVLCYMASVFCYVLCFFIRHVASGKGE